MRASTRGCSVLNQLDVNASLNELNAMVDVLADDSLELMKNVRAEASNCALRAYLRAFWALVEGSCFGLRQLALSLHHQSECFTDAEVSLLNEVAYELSRDGKIKPRPKYLDILGGVKFTFCMFIKAFELPNDVESDLEGWRLLSEALQLRHRITHPKSAIDLRLSDNDGGNGGGVDVISSASLWFIRRLRQLLTAAQNAS